MIIISAIIIKDTTNIAKLSLIDFVWSISDRPIFVTWSIGDRRI